jgi:hypothetical protein
MRTRAVVLVWVPLLHPQALVAPQRGTAWVQHLAVAADVLKCTELATLLADGALRQGHGVNWATGVCWCYLVSRHVERCHPVRHLARLLLRAACSAGLAGAAAAVCS